jgi:hypothetical protein
MSVIHKHLCIQHEWDGTPLPESHWVMVDLRWGDDGLQIDVEAPFFDNPAPSDAPNSETGFWQLWDYEVVEVFLVDEKGAYTEIEVGPHGHHLILRLDAPRSVVDKMHPMVWNAEVDGERWRGRGLVATHLLPINIERVNAFAIRTVGERRQYCCHTPLPAAQPDFHQPSRFALWDEI